MEKTFTLEELRKEFNLWAFTDESAKFMNFMDYIDWKYAELLAYKCSICKKAFKVSQEAILSRIEERMKNNNGGIPTEEEVLICKECLENNHHSS